MSGNPRWFQRNSRREKFERSVEATVNAVDAGNFGYSCSFDHISLGRRKNRYLRLTNMTRETEAEAWVRGDRQIIHSQKLIQLLTVFAIAMPLPIMALTFWAVFGLNSPIVIQSITTTWVVSTIAYGACAVHTRMKQRRL